MSAPRCPLCDQPRRWNKVREAYARYCGRSMCTAVNRTCDVCQRTFDTATPEAKGRTCSEACREAVRNRPLDRSPKGECAEVVALRAELAHVLRLAATALEGGTK